MEYVDKLSEELNLVQNPVLTINDLHDPCLEHIFLYVPVLQRVQLRKVCKRWRSVSDDCWRKIHSFGFHGAGNTSAVEEYDRGEGIVVFTPSDIKLAVEFVKRCGPYLTTLSSNMCSMVFFRAVYRKCRNVRNLYIHIDAKRTDLLMSKFIQTRKNLINVSLDFFTTKYYRCLKEVSPKALKGLYLGFGYGEIVQPDLLFTINQIIRDADSIKEFESNLMDDESLRMLSERKTLESMKLEYLLSPLVTDHGLSYIFCMNNLKCLGIEIPRKFSMSGVDNHFMRRVSKSCQMLEKMVLAEPKITDEGMLALLELPHLTTLEINDASFISDAPLKYFCQLKSLTLRHCKNVKETGIIEFLHLSQVLEYLDLGCCGITNETVITANQSVKRRKNEIPLKLHVSRDINPQEPQDKSPRFTLDVGLM